MSSREFLNTLWKEIVVDRKISFSLDTELCDSELFLKSVICQPLDIETLDNPATVLSSGLPFLFTPVSPDVLRRYPLTQETLSAMRFFDSGNPPVEHTRFFPWTLSMSIQEVCNYVADWALGYRPNLPSRFNTLSTFSGLEPVHIPNPFLLSRGIHGNLPDQGSYETHAIFEAASENGHPTHPHVIMMMRQSFDGREGSMLYGELAPIISAMRSRAFQPKVKEHEKEALFEYDEPFDKKPRAFPNEKQFPVLLLSFLGPQHARIFYACVHEGKSLIIHRSKLYSFEKLADAPVELFTRFLMSKPKGLRKHFF